MVHIGCCFHLLSTCYMPNSLYAFSQLTFTTILGGGVVINPILQMQKLSCPRSLSERGQWNSSRSTRFHHAVCGGLLRRPSDSPSVWSADRTAARRCLPLHTEAPTRRAEHSPAVSTCTSVLSLPLLFLDSSVLPTWLRFCPAEMWSGRRPGAE